MSEQGLPILACRWELMTKQADFLHYELNTTRQNSATTERRNGGTALAAVVK